MAEPAIGRTIWRGASPDASRPHHLPESPANKFGSTHDPGKHAADPE
jgi:hypothetical protein